MTHRLKKACQEHAKFQYSVSTKRSPFLSISPEGNIILIRFNSIEKFYDFTEKQFSLIEKIFKALPPAGDISFSQLELQTRIAIHVDIENYERGFLFQQQMLRYPVPYLTARGELDASILQLQMENHVKELSGLFDAFSLNKSNLKELLRQVDPALRLQPKRMNAEEYTEQAAKKRLTNFGKTTLFPPTPTKNQWDDPGCAEEDLKLFSELVKHV